jgi:hypothetical protein
MREHVALHGGTAIFLHKVARFVGCAVLLGVSVATLILEETGQVEDATTGNYLKHGYLKNRISDKEAFSEAEWLQVALCITTVRGFVNICVRT